MPWLFSGFFVRGIDKPMPNLRKVLTLALIVTAWAGLLYGSFLRHRDAPMFDFAPTYVAATMIGSPRLRGHIYDHDPEYLNRVPADGPFARAARSAGFERMSTPYVYPPFYAWLLAPLTAVTYAASKTIILILGALAFTGGFVLAWREAARVLPWRPVFLVAPLLLLLFTPLDYNNWLGQISAVIFALLCLSLYLARRGHAVAAGVVLGVCLSVKLQPVGVVVLLLARRRFRLLAFAAGTVAALLLLSGFVGGFDLLGRYVALIGGVLSRGSLASWNNQTIVGMFLRATHPAVEMTRWRYLAPSWWMSATQVAVALGFAVWFARRPRSDGAVGDVTEELTVAYVGGILVSLLLRPIVWNHAHILALLPLLWLLAKVARVEGFRTRLVWLAALGVVWTLLALDPRAMLSALFETPPRAAAGGWKSLAVSLNLLGVLALAAMTARFVRRGPVLE